MPILEAHMHKEEYPAEPSEADADNLRHFVLNYRKLYDDGMIQMNHKKEFQMIDDIVIDEYPSAYYG